MDGLNESSLLHITIITKITINTVTIGQWDNGKGKKGKREQKCYSVIMK